MLTVATFLSCNSNIDNIIFDFELVNNHIQVDKLESKGSYIPFYARDSVTILDSHYDSVLSKKLKLLDIQLKEANKKWENADKELKTIKNPLMIKAYGSRVKILKEREKQIEKIIFIYKNSPEQTGLNKIIEKKRFYKEMPDSILGYTITVLFTGKLGALPERTYERGYLFNPDRNKIFGTINPS